MYTNILLLVYGLLFTAALCCVYYVLKYEMQALRALISFLTGDEFKFTQDNEKILKAIIEFIDKSNDSHYDNFNKLREATRDVLDATNKALDSMYTYTVENFEKRPIKTKNRFYKYGHGHKNSVHRKK